MIPDPELDLSAARLSVTWRSVGTHQVFAVFEDRTAWFWALADIGSHADLVGSFLTSLESEAWNDVCRVADRVPGLGGRRADGLGVSLTAGDESGWVELGTTTAEDVGSAVLPVVAAARDAPESAARFAGAAATAPTGQRVVGLTVTSIGRRPVRLRFDPSSFTATTETSQPPVADPRLGLVDGNGNLLDGLYQDAVIPPDGNGACVLQVDVEEPLVAVATRGAIALVGPWSVEPMMPFEASGPVAPH